MPSASVAAPVRADLNDNGICDTNDADGLYGIDRVGELDAYDAEATFNDGSCDFTSCLNFGSAARHPGACNYDENADFNDASCVYPQLPYGCDGECINDSDEDGICDEFEIPGCMDVEACNYSGAGNRRCICDELCVP